MPGNHIIVGAGAVGTAIARLLADSGEHVTIISRSGSGPEHPRVDRVGLDAGDAAALVAPRLEDGDGAISTAQPRVPRWTRAGASQLRCCAEKHPGTFVTRELYPPVGYGTMTVHARCRHRTKGRVRAQMWADAKAAHDAGRVRAVEVRGSDYLGNGAESHVNRLVPRILAGKNVRVVGSADQPHSWTFVPDVARTLVTVASDERAWGRIWLVPTGPPRTQREAVHDLCRAAGVPPVKVGVVPHVALRAVGVASPTMRLSIACASWNRSRAASPTISSSRIIG